MIGVMQVIKLKPIWFVIFYTILHFLIDCICAFEIFSNLLNDDINRTITIFLVYNIIAFCFQPFIGLFIDKYKNSERLFLIASILFLCLGVLSIKIPYLISCISLGLSNAFFHISGGKYVISKTNNNIIALGVFVSTGAFGLALGTNIHSGILYIIVTSLIVLFTVLILLFKDKEEIDHIDRNIKITSSEMISLVMIIIFVVFLRAFVGKIQLFNFEKPLWVLLSFGAFAMMGKALGGLLAKFLGINLTIIITMSLAMILLLFFNDNIYLSLIGIMLFNSSMPLTLYLMNELFPHHEGFAFGILAAVLAPGVFLGYLDLGVVAVKVIVTLGCLLSAILIILANYKLNKVKERI